jgi:outer membrane biosynthesis protein TonB
MFSSVPDQKPVGPKPFLLSLAVHGIAAVVFVYGASLAGGSRVALHPMVAPELAENMIYLPPDVSTHASFDAPAPAAPAEEKPALTTPTKEQQEAKVEVKPEPQPEPKTEAKPEQPKPETTVADAKPADTPPEQNAEQQGGYMRANAMAPHAPNMMAMMAYMAQHHRVSDPQPIYTPVPTAVQGKLPPEFGGDVFVEVVIDAEGKIAEAHLMQPLIPSLTEDILSVVRQWRFVPASYNGESVPTRHQFRLHVG